MNEVRIQVCPGSSATADVRCTSLFRLKEETIPFIYYVTYEHVTVFQNKIL